MWEEFLILPPLEVGRWVPFNEALLHWTTFHSAGFLYCHIKDVMELDILTALRNR